METISIPCMPNKKVCYEKDGEIIEDELFMLSIANDSSMVYVTRNNVILLACNFGVSWKLKIDEIEKTKYGIIEEMGKVLCEGYPDECNSCTENPCKWEDGCCSVDEDIEKLYNAGYRKIIKGEL